MQNFQLTVASEPLKIELNKFNWILKQIQEPIINPTEYELEQNYPNPFNPSTEIAFSLPEKTKVQLDIYNMLGRKIAALVNEELPAGRYKVKWNANGFASGVYFTRLQSAKYMKSRKMILLR